MFTQILVLSSLFAFLPVNSGQLPQPVCDQVGEHAAQRPSIYIIHVRKPEHMLSSSPEEVEEWHKSFLPSPALDSGEPRMVFSYKVVISGFAARLTAEEVRAMETKEGFLHAQPDEELVPQTTHSPDFLDLRPNVWRAANRGQGCIIGVVDTGIDHEHVSFVANPIPDPPGWNGWCKFNDRRTCNGKLVGATYRISDTATRLPFDCRGHGTHVAGIAAALQVQGANVHGSAAGTASGAAPEAYLALYGAPNAGSEILRAVDQAIQDGVHIISISMGRGGKVHFYDSAIAKGALAAVRHGILVSSSAGNRGPGWCTVGNDAPWIMTVGASTMGRVLSLTLRLGNGAEIPGESLYRRTGLSAGLVYPGASNVRSAQFCSALDGADVTGKVVMCLRGGGTSAAQKANVVLRAGGVAVVLMNTQNMGSIITEIPDVVIPTVAVNFPNSRRLINYVNTATPRRPPWVELVPRGTLYGVAPFPAVPSFSSRGPSLVNGGILKPDILGPGVNILSAQAGTHRGFVLKSGTSMATPHLSGIAAILKQHLPAETGLHWTPAMIRSAIITTAETSNRQGGPITDETDEPADPFATGAGHVKPAAAMDPGLVYDLSFDDYLRYLCGLEYTDTQVEVAAGATVNCADPLWRVDPGQLNYPSISVTLNSAVRTKTIKRTARHVWSEPSTYKAKVTLDLDNDGDDGERPVEVTVTPDTLHFSAPGENRTFQVTFSLPGDDEEQSGDYLAGKLRWVSKTHTVTSPLHITFGESQTAQYGCS